MSIDGQFSGSGHPLEGQIRKIINNECAFTPRVVTGKKGDILEIANYDPILHNTHIIQGNRTFLNVAQLPNSRTIRKRIKREGVHHIRCDKHTFMEAVLVVFDHPLF